MSANVLKVLLNAAPSMLFINLKTKPSKWKHNAISETIRTANASIGLIIRIVLSESLLPLNRNVGYFYPFMPRPMKGTLANSVDTDQTPQKAASDQGLLFTFNTEISYKKVTMKITNKTPF